MTAVYLVAGAILCLTAVLGGAAIIMKAAERRYAKRLARAAVGEGPDDEPEDEDWRDQTRRKVSFAGDTIARSSASSFDHVGILVRDLDRAVKDYQRILNVLDPEQSRNIIRDEGKENGYKLRWATFVNPKGASLQFLESEHPADQRFLARHGDRVHHLSFSSSNIRRTVENLEEAGIPLTKKDLANASNMPWLKWTFVPPDKAHGVLVEVSTRYSVEDDHWIPHPENEE